MATVRSSLAVSLTALVVLLVALGAHNGLDRGAGLDVATWVVGLACWLVVSGAVRRGASACGLDVLGPADLVTLTRTTIACAVAALVAESFAAPLAVHTPLVALATTALALDAVDGRVARRTGTSSPFGARFDGEADAFLMLVLSLYVARSFGAWVLLIGLARYLFALAGLALPWLRGALPVRRWAKAVAAIQGVVLVLAAADLAPRPVSGLVLGLALVLLVESFAWSVLWLWRDRSAEARGTTAQVVRVRVARR